MHPRIGLACLLLLVAAAPASAAQTWTVTQTADASGLCTNGGACSLRQAITSASDGDTVVVPANPTPYTIASTPIAKDKSLTITGGGARTTTVQGGSGGAATLLFNLGGSADTSITISGLLFTGGNNHATQGGGAFSLSAGTFVFRDVGIVANTATAPGGGITNDFGGGIAMAPGAALTVDRSLISGNTVTGTGGNGNGGGIGGTGTLTITDSTIVGNASHATGGFTGFGGGVTSPSGTKLTMSGVTMSGNTADDGGDLYGAVGSGGFAKIADTIITAGTATTGANCHIVSGTVTSLGSNLDSKNQCGFTAGSDKHDTDPLLSALANNGGPTDTMALGVGSPAIRAATGCSATDQRGFPRSSTCSIGAWEPQPPVVAATASPASGLTGQSLTFNASVTNGDGGTPAVTWAFDDGATATGTQVTHAFAAPGTHTATATATDPLGLTGSGPVLVSIAAPSNPPDTTPPAVTALHLSATAFRAAKSGATLSAARKKKPPIGTTVSYVLSEAATTGLAVDRRSSGRRKGKHCVAPKRAAKHAKPCMIWKRLKGDAAAATSAGAQHRHFSGRLRGKPLPAGRYRLTLVAVDAAGNRSKPIRTTFRIVR